MCFFPRTGNEVPTIPIHSNRLRALEGNKYHLSEFNKDVFDSVQIKNLFVKYAILKGGQKGWTIYNSLTNKTLQTKPAISNTYSWFSKVKYTPTLISKAFL